MKKYITILAAALLAFSSTARADDAGLTSFGVPTTITNNVANTGVTGGVVKIDKQHSAALIVKFQGNGSGTANVAVQLARSYDGVNFESTPPAALRFTNALANTTQVIGYHEINPDLIRSAHSLKITSIQNYDNTVSGTNALIGLLKKKER